MQDISIPVSFARAVLRHTEAHGIDPQAALARCSIPRLVLDDDGARITARQYADLQTLIMREMRDELLGYLHKPVRLGAGAALAHWMLHSRNLRQALGRYCQFFNIVGAGINARIVTGADAVELTFALEGRSGPPAPYAVELVMFGVHRFCCWMARQHVQIGSVTLAYPSPSHAREYRAIFLGAPIEFSGPKNRMCFDREQLQLPIRQDQESLDRFLRHPQHNLLLGDYNQASWISKTRSELRSNLVTMPTLVDVARRFGLRPKQLRRRLKAEGIGYGELKVQLRRDVAVELLADPQKSIDEISYLTGFSDASAFIRAFREWTGFTPTSYRKHFY